MQKEPVSWPQRSEIYSKIQAQAVTTLIKFTGPALLGYLIATSLRSGDKIAIKLSNFEASVPASYFLLSLSILFLFLLIALNNLSTALSLKASIAGKILLPGFSIGAYEAIMGRDELSLGVPISQYGYWKEALGLSSVVIFFLSIILISLVIPFFALGFFLAQQQISILLDKNTNVIEMVASGFGILSVVSGILALFLFHLPMPFSKNQTHVRWGFLWRLPIQPSDEERTDRWLNGS